MSQFRFFLSFWLLVLIPSAFGQKDQDQEQINDPCSKIPIPELTNKQAKEILKKRKQINCDKIYQNREKKFNVILGNTKKRFVQLSAEANLASLPEIGHLIAIKEKMLCLYFKGIPEITEEFRRCRERQIDEWEKSIIRRVIENQKQQKKEEEKKTKEREIRVISEEPSTKKQKLQEQLAQSLIEDLEETYSFGLRIIRELEQDNLRLRDKLKIKTPSF